MPSYRAPVDDTLFLLNDVLQFERYGNLPGFADVTPDLVAQILSEAGKLCEEVLQPLNRVGRRARLQARRRRRASRRPPGFKAGLSTPIADGGWIGLAVPAEYDGQGLPYTLAVAMNEYRLLRQYGLRHVSGPDAGRARRAAAPWHRTSRRRLYLPKMAAGRWTGTMNLTEPHCGTDLGLLTTKAAPRADGSYSITGQKIFISAGEHDLAENIIHLVLARIEGAPAGVKGISLFIVPKVLVDADGSLGARNARLLRLASKHKMGIHGNATCVMNYDGAHGLLVGEPNRGLNAMFVMMNEARLGVAMQGLAQSEVAYQNALAYAKERLQGRALTGREEAGQAGRSDHRASRRAAHAAWRSRPSTRRRAALRSPPRSTATSRIAPKTPRRVRRRTIGSG